MVLLPRRLVSKRRMQELRSEGVYAAAVVLIGPRESIIDLTKGGLA